MPLPGKSQRNIWSTGDFLGQCEQWTVVWSPNFGTQKARSPPIVFKTITNCRRKFWMQGFWTNRAFQLLGWWNLCQHGELPKWWLWMITDDYGRLWMIPDHHWWFLMVMDYYWLLLMIMDDYGWLLMIIDDVSLLLITIDYYWLLLSTVDCYWLLLIIIDDDWWWLMIITQYISISLPFP